MGQALYRKYRSKSLGEIIGQEHITKTLGNALKKGAISHAYLFTGPRGVGKTSIARILAYEVNGLPYDEQATHLDIIEIDAASNRRIDEIRELRERINSSPAAAKYKVYIIDEVHMLTKEAFNALLKTLEEPPAHAIFILATTEAHKLPETIISRTQRFTFRPIDEKAVVEHLKSIADTENFKITDDALELIAKHGGGSFRDSISLLDQARSMGKAGLSDVQRMLGIAPKEAIEQLFDYLKQVDADGLLSHLEELKSQGYTAASIAKQLSSYIRPLLGQPPKPFSRSDLTALMSVLIEVQASHDPQTLLEISLLDVLPADTQAPAEPMQELAKPKQTIENQKKVTKPQKSSTVKETYKEDPPSTKAKSELSDELWQQTLQAIKKQHNTLYSVCRMATTTFEGNKLVMYFTFPFHQKRISETKNKQVIEKILAETAGSEVSLECRLVNKSELENLQPGAMKTPADLSTINNIFGNAEVIE